MTNRKSDKEKMITLLSIPKSGTNMCRTMLYNYFCLLKGDDEPKNYDHLSGSFPNTIKKVIDGNVRPCEHWLLPNQYSDFIYGHTLRFGSDNIKPPFIGLYRNPLDQLVSYYHFKYADRVNPQRDIKSPGNIIDVHLQRYINNFKKMRKLKKKGTLKLVSYEDLLEFGPEYLQRICRFLEITIDKEKLNLAALRSTPEMAKRHEKKVGYLHTVDRQQAKSKYIKGARFVRDGSIGQWKKHFSHQEVDRVMKTLEIAGLPLHHFVFEPRKTLKSQITHHINPLIQNKDIF